MKESQRRAEVAVLTSNPTDFKSKLLQETESSLYRDKEIDSSTGYSNCNHGHPTSGHLNTKTNISRSEGRDRQQHNSFRRLQCDSSVPFSARTDIRPIRKQSCWAGLELCFGPNGPDDHGTSHSAAEGTASLRTHSLAPGEIMCQTQNSFHRFVSHQNIKSKVNNRRKAGKFTNIWTLSHS